MTNAKFAGTIFLITIMAIFAISCMPDTEETLQNEAASRTNGIEGPLYYFDHTSIEIQKTSAIGLDLKNLNLWVDMYGNLIILGEVENSSDINKSDIVLTFDFIDSGGQNIFTIEKKSKTKYLLSGQIKPFWQYVDHKEKYIEIDAVKVGVNYNNFYDRFSGNPVVQEEKFYYQDKYLVIEGQLINMGMRKIEDLVLLATFYNYMDKVVFVRECHLNKKDMGPQEAQKFELKILLDKYLPDFTAYSFSVFFRDSVSLEPMDPED